MLPGGNNNVACLRQRLRESRKSGKLNEVRELADPISAQRLACTASAAITQSTAESSRDSPLEITLINRKVSTAIYQSPRIGVGALKLH